jgi:hypothetical protein
MIREHFNGHENRYGRHGTCNFPKPRPEGQRDKNCYRVDLQSASEKERGDELPLNAISERIGEWSEE